MKQKSHKLQSQRKMRTILAQTKLKSATSVYGQFSKAENRQINYTKYQKAYSSCNLRRLQPRIIRAYVKKRFVTKADECCSRAS